jgi:hypothetical protein
MNPTDNRADQAVVASSEFDDEADRIQHRLHCIAGTLDQLTEDVGRIAGTLDLLAALRG